jgi:hypothetical protein
MEASDLAYRARALAQAHALTETAIAFRTHHIDAERSRQGMAQFAEWAAVAFLTGYCVRRVEESVTDVDSLVAAAIDAEVAMRVATALRTDQPVTLLDDAVVVEALDRVILSEIAKRADQWKEQIDAADWAEFETYIAWWVTFGYGARTAETSATLR